jgi:hypothetical protein
MHILVIGYVYVMGGERFARWEYKTLELKDTKIPRNVPLSLYIYIYIYLSLKS